jgi:hypothetical protein
MYETASHHPCGCLVQEGLQALGENGVDCFQLLHAVLTDEVPRVQCRLELGLHLVHGGGVEGIQEDLLQTCKRGRGKVY